MSPLFPDRYIDDIDDNYMAPLLDEVARDVRPARVLDVGCGNGLFGGYLKRKSGCRLTGIDASPYGLERSREAGYDETALFEELGVKPLPFGDNAFDLVLCKDVFEHLLYPLELAQEISRVLKPGGRLLSHVPNHFTFPARARFLFSNDIDTYKFYPDSKEWDFPHIRFYTRPGFIELHRKTGFVLEKDLSLFFAVRAPKLWRLPGYSLALAGLDRLFPSSFTAGFTGLFRAPKNAA